MCIRDSSSSSSSSSAAAAPVANPTRAAQAKKNEKPRINAKEKVKNQRLCGQSGIGDDFKVWKSDEEMRMRQQFD